MSYKIKLTTGLLGLTLTIVAAQAIPPSLSYKVSGNELIITYTGTLLRSVDAVNWTEVAWASSPYKVALSDKKLFFCAKGTKNQNMTIPLSYIVDLDLIWIEPGTFMMGSPKGEPGRLTNEELHQVTLTQGYWLGKYEVTQEQYETIMGTNPSDVKEDVLPVDSVSWNEAMEFCAKLNAQEKAAGRLPEGYEYSLPTESQWEYACRAGTTTALNSGKNLSDELRSPEVDEVGWYWYNCDETHRVGQKKPNAWGLYDMHGNVQEWCLDWYDDHYPTYPVKDPTGPDTGWSRVLRGGGWDRTAHDCRSANRRHGNPDTTRSANVGFRVALAPIPVPSKDIAIRLSTMVVMPMIWIEPGTFMMGSPKDELGRYSNETQRQVTLTRGYWLGMFEVTQAQYEAVMGTNPSHIKGSNLPVSRVDWNDAMKFCEKLTANEKAAGRLPEGYKYTLPTEAQWEYACRAGTTTALNSGKNLTSTAKCSNMDEVGWYEFNSEETLHDVGLKKPNDWRLYDMHGNVYEWCLDWYEDFPATPVTDPMGPSTGTKRVFRGGCYYFSGIDCRSGCRYGDFPTDEYWGSGFRVALAPVQ